MCSVLVQQVREAQLAALDSVCGVLPASSVHPLLARLCRAADSGLVRAVLPCLSVHDACLPSNRDCWMPRLG